MNASRFCHGLWLILFISRAAAAAGPDRFILEVPYSTVEQCDQDAPVFGSRLETMTGTPYSVTCTVYKAPNFPDTILLVFVASANSNPVLATKIWIEGRLTTLMNTETLWEFDAQDQIVPTTVMKTQTVVLPFADLKDCEAMKSKILTEPSDIYVALCVARNGYPGLLTYQNYRGSPPWIRTFDLALQSQCR